MDKSYGVNVAKLAGLPEEITERAAELLSAFEAKKNIGKEQIKEVKKEEKSGALKEEIKKRDPMARSPLDALNYLIDLKKRVK